MNKRIKLMFIFLGIIMVLVSAVFMQEKVLDKSSEGSFSELDRLEILHEGPTYLTFYADYLNFTDGNLTLTFDEGLMFSPDLDYLRWNLGNETFLFKRVNETKGEGIDVCWSTDEIDMWKEYYEE